MADQEKYDLIFCGELVKGADLAATKLNIGKLFKIGPEKVDSMFSGRAITLKKGLDLDAANRYRVAIKKAGARIDLKLQESGAASPPPQGKANFGASEAKPVVAKDLGPSAAEKDDGMSLAAVGADILSDEDKKPIQAVEVNTSGFTLKANEGNLLDDSEYKIAEAPAINLDGITLSEAGGDLLRAEEKHVQPEVNLDLDEYSLAELGAKLGPDAPAEPPAPDVSNISLQKIES